MKDALSPCWPCLGCPAINQHRCQLYTCLPKGTRQVSSMPSRSASHLEVAVEQDEVAVLRAAHSRIPDVIQCISPFPSCKHGSVQHARHNVHEVPVSAGAPPSAW